MDALARDPHHAWSPNALLDHVRNNKRPVGAPGERFLYSDTGFVLLGKTLEQATSSRSPDLITERIITPLGLKRTFLPHRTDPLSGSNRIAPCFLKTEDLSHTAALTAGWAGGSIASTPDDLVRFSEALHGGELLNKSEYHAMTRITHHGRPGVRYGSAMMWLRFEGFSPFLRGLPRPLGHLGSLATALFYDPVHHIHLAMNFHSRREISQAVRSTIAVTRALVHSRANR